MKIENLKLGDIIVYEIDEFLGNDNKRVFVVGSQPIVKDGKISFHPVLKKNKKEEFFVSENVHIIDMENNAVEDINPLAGNIDDDLLHNQIEVANKKARWAIDNIIVEDDEVVNEEIPDLPQKKVYRFYVEVIANEDVDPWETVDIHEAIGDYADPKDPVETKVIELND